MAHRLRLACRAALLVAAAAACGGTQDGDVAQPAATGCRDVVCHCAVLDADTLAPRLQLARFTARACTDQPWLEASRLCRSAVGTPCSCGPCDPSP